MKLKRTIGALLCFVMLLSLLPMGVFATNAGDRFVADNAAWGTQGNNGWYYMYKLTDGTYHEMNFYDSTDEVGWRQNAYASDLSTTVEMFFINQTACFYGENDTRPVYAYKAPASGRVVLTTQTHSTSEMRMQVYVGDKLQKIHGKDEMILSQTGPYPGAMTKTDLILDVSKDEMIYVEFYSADKTVQRQAWINEYSVKYLSVKDTADYTGTVLAPNADGWGTQDNNGWYYMYKLSSGAIHEMNFYDANDGIDWRKNAYASDLSTTVEMFFINQTSFFTGENGTRPVYAFKAPVGGQIKLYFETHGVADMFAQVYIGDKLQTINGSDRTTFTTTGTLPGAMTANELTLNVKKDEMVYIVCGTTGASRQGWLQNQKVTYLSTNDEIDYTAITYAASSSNWGKQDNNGWFYMYDYRDTGAYGLLNFYDASASIDWQKNNFAFDPGLMAEMLFVQQNHFFTGELGSKVVYGFKAPASGTLDVYFETHGNENITAQAFVEDSLVQINGADTLVFSAGALEGAFAPNNMTVNMAKGEMLYIVCSSAIRDGWFRNPSAKYTHVCSSNVTETEAVAPTCTTAGNISYFTCSCGKIYSDAACTTVITEADTVLPVIGHNYENGVCTGCGKESHMSIYFQNNWLWTEISLYYWYADGSYDVAWPGAAMNYYGNDGTYDVYTLEVPTDATGMVISGIRNDGSGNSDQTPDITSGWYDGICYYMLWDDGNTTGSEPIDVIIPPVCEHDYTYTNNGDNHTVGCANCDYSAVEDHTYVEGACVCGAIEGPVPASDLVFRNKTLSLQSYIAFNITARNSVLQNYDSWYVVFERYDHIAEAVVSETVEGVPYGSSYQLFEYKVSSYMMTDSITATLYAVKDGVTYKGEVYTDSVENFVVSRMAAAADSSADMATLYADLLTYGAKAQTFLGYNVEALADAKLGEYASYVTTTAPTAENLYAETSNGLTGATKNKLALGISSAVQIQLRINLDAAYDVNTVYGELTYTRGSENITQRIDGKDFTKSGSRYVLIFDAITAVDGRAPVAITIYDASGNAISETWTYSISSYLVDGGLSGNGLATMEALLNYFDSAAIVFGGAESRFVRVVSNDADASGWSALIP